jgi:hypothetical protein
MKRRKIIQDFCYCHQVAFLTAREKAPSGRSAPPGSALAAFFGLSQSSPPVLPFKLVDIVYSG